MNGPAITLEDVSVKFQMGRRVNRGGFEALHDISLQVQHGERLGIIGRNGAGKSTLLRVLADVLKPDSGKIARNHGAVLLLSIGAGFMQNLTGRENAVLSGLIQGMRRQEIVSRLEQIKEFSGLGDFFDEPVKTYSSGMRSRLGFSVAIQQHADIILIDETLSVGDAAFQEKSKRALADRIESGCGVILVSHQVDFLLQICETLIWMERGEIRMMGAAAEVARAYRVSP